MNTQTEPQTDQPPLFEDYTVVCPECRGKGIITRYWGDSPCQLCKGKGRVYDILADQWERIGN